MNTQANTQGATPNKMSFADLTAVAKELGEQAGKGKDTQVKFGLKLVEGAYHGAIDVDANKHGTGIDDATKLAEEYVKAQSSAVVFDAKAPNQRKLISCCRKLVQLGMWPKGGTGEPLHTMNSLMTERQKLRQKPENANKLDDAFNTLMKYARQQIKRDHVLPQDELIGLCYKNKSPLASAEDILDSTRKTLMKLRDGKASNGTAKDDSTHVVAAIGELTKRLKAIAAEKGAKQGAAPKPKS